MYLTWPCLFGPPFNCIQRLEVEGKCMGRGSCILDVATRLRWAVWFTLRPLYTQEGAYDIVRVSFLGICTSDYRFWLDSLQHFYATERRNKHRIWSNNILRAAHTARTNGEMLFCTVVLSMRKVCHTNLPPGSLSLRGQDKWHGRYLCSIMVAEPHIRCEPGSKDKTFRPVDKNSTARIITTLSWIFNISHATHDIPRLNTDTAGVNLFDVENNSGRNLTRHLRTVKANCVWFVRNKNCMLTWAFTNTRRVLGNEEYKILITWSANIFQMRILRFRTSHWFWLPLIADTNVLSKNWSYQQHHTTVSISLLSSLVYILLNIHHILKQK